MKFQILPYYNKKKNTEKLMKNENPDSQKWYTKFQILPYYYFKKDKESDEERNFLF